MKIVAFRGDQNSMKYWYLVHTKPRKERVAEQNLQRQDYEVYLPLIQQPRRQRGRWIEAIDPLFPRYLFVRLRPGYDNIGSIRCTTGVRNLVRFTAEPTVVPDHIIESIKHAADHSTGLHHPKGSLFEPGNTVIIDKGPLTGLRGIFLAETDQERVIILLEMLGRENRVTVQRDLLRLA
jgi:transcriptional antiterminator RfaH